MSQPGKRTRAQRGAGGVHEGGSGTLELPVLYIVPPPDSSVSYDVTPMWHGDPNTDSADYTRLSDWPTRTAFAKLIKAALAAGNHEAAAQLREDMRYCASMRRKIRMNGTGLMPSDDASST
jgi:hypothetical protein